MMRSSLIALLCCGLLACDDGSTQSPVTEHDAGAGAGGAGGQPVNDLGTGGTGGTGGQPADMGTGGAGGAIAPTLARSVGRMTIEQIARSIPVVTDGLRWTEDFGEGEFDMLTVLAPTMGAPDYLRVTQENLEPTLIIAKFMADAANRICVRWVDRDQAQAPGDRSLVTHSAGWTSTDATDVSENLRALNLRFYSRHIAADDAQSIAPLTGLFQAVANAGPPTVAARNGWLAVCIAMMTDPEFVLY